MGATLTAAQQLATDVATLERLTVAQAAEIAELKALVADLNTRLRPSPVVTGVGSSAYPGSLSAFTSSRVWSAGSAPGGCSSPNRPPRPGTSNGSRRRSTVAGDRSCR